jgi:hypothetical protein
MFSTFAFSPLLALAYFCLIVVLKKFEALKSVWETISE